MFELWAPEHSVLREKVIEHIFLAELSRTLLLDLKLPFEVLRAEFDANGYDVAIEAGGLLRHVQLKATTALGRRANVDVQLSLANKPGGCIIWIYVDPETLQLGPFLWFGGEAGRPLPPLGDREVKHSRGNATGAKGVRPGLRRLPKGAFTRFETLKELAKTMFPAPSHQQVLERHLSQRLGENVTEAAHGMTWESSAPVAYMIAGYELAKEAGIEYPMAFMEQMRRDAERTGQWKGSLLELWLALYLEHRRDRHQSQGAIGSSMEIESMPMLEELCEAVALAIRDWRS